MWEDEVWQLLAATAGASGVQTDEDTPGDRLTAELYGSAGAPMSPERAREFRRMQVLASDGEVG
jgi:hypothetical protein